MSYPQLSDTIPIELGNPFASFVSGANNEQRICLKYYLNEESGAVFAQVTFGELAQGPPGHAHGGAISAVFDELMGVCCWVNGYPAMTAQYTTRFFKPVPLQEEVIFCAEVKEVDGSKIKLKAKLINANNDRYAEAKGLFILQDMATFEKMSQMTETSYNYAQSFVKST